SEWQPGIRLGWALGARAYTWAAVSRAVRLPNRLDTDAAIRCPVAPELPGCPAGTARVVGNDDLDSEKLLALEWGIRLWQGSRYSVDLALFDNHYDDLRSTELEGATPVDVAFANRLRGRGRGGELAMTWQPRRDLNVALFYSHLDLEIAQRSSTDPTTRSSIEGSNPENMGGFRIGWKPAPRWSADALLRVVDDLPFQDVPSYAELNLRLGFQVRPDLELALVGENLLDAHHPEFGTDTPARIEVERAVLLQLHWSHR
ncbi:MAG TPA: TonB-dependent receptor, partial [Nevskiaceae bacterium]|nr:TonB-dependent receptor [Nevskiaceae bacterium]